MKTEFLKGLGLEQDVVDKIMAENGRTLLQRKQRLPKLRASVTTSKISLRQQQNLLEKFKDVDPAAMQERLISSISS